MNCINYIQYFLVLQRQRNEHQITFGYLIQLTAFIHQSNGDAHDAREMKLKLSHQLFNFDDLKRDFDKDMKTGYGICGMEMLKKNMIEKNWKDKQKPWEDRKKPLIKSKLNSSCEAEGKITVQKMNLI